MTIQQLVRERNDLWIAQLWSHGDFDKSGFHRDWNDNLNGDGVKENEKWGEWQRVPKTTPGFNNLLRVLTELSTVVPTSIIYWSERIPKLKEGKKCDYKRDSCSDVNVLFFDCFDISILFVILYYSFARCHHWGKLGKGYTNLNYSLQLHMYLQLSQN